MVGATISHCKVLSKLGEGGMGVVYKAEDTKLDRHVALKFLATHLLKDEEALKRFHREAKAAAALHHPNVCPVYEIGEVDDQTFLAMAFIEGDSLDKRIEQGPLKIPETIDIAHQIAMGLEAAHEKGIVHRDIKPGNVMVDEKGHVTVMDFGLALLTEGSKLTKFDTTLGTVAYMSPEQAEGAEVDHRTDLWALGCVLYEMVCSQRPFKGLYDQALVYEILNEDYEPVTGVRAGVPMELEWIVGKCLAKDLGERYSGAKDLILDLTTLRKKPLSGRSTVVRTRPAVLASDVDTQDAAEAEAPAASSAPGPRHTRHDAGTRSESGDPSPIPGDRRPIGKQRERLVLAIAALAVALSIALSVLHFTEPEPRFETRRFQIHEPEGVRFGRRAAEISPDGRHLAFIGVSEGTRRIWVRSLDSLEARPLTGTDGARHPFWSPDSRFLGFFADRKLKKIEVAGGPPQTLCDAGSGAGATWMQGSNDGEGAVVFSPSTRNALLRVSDAGGEPVSATILNMEAGETSHRHPHFLPGGRHFLYTAWQGANNRTVLLGDLNSAQSSSAPLLRDDTPVRYAPPSAQYPKGYILFAREDSLMAQEFDAGRLEAVGQPFPVAEGVRAGSSNIAPSDFSVSRTGVLAYRSVLGSWGFQLARFDRSGERLGVVGEPGPHTALSVSPDRTRVAVSHFEDNRDIWIHDLERNVASRFTFDAGLDFSHTWSPDGRQLAYSSFRNSSSDLYLKPTSGAGEPELLLETDNNKGPRDWPPDGRVLLFVELSPTTNWDLWVLPMEGERKPIPYLRTEFAETLGQFSPDGRWVAYVSNESGRGEIYVQPYPADGGKWQVSTDGGTQPRWRADGKELFYLTVDNKVMAAEIQAGETFRAGVPNMLFQAPEVNPFLPETIFHYDVADNGRRFLIDIVAEDTERTPVTIVLDWQAELGR